MRAVNATRAASTARIATGLAAARDGDAMTGTHIRNIRFTDPGDGKVHRWPMDSSAVPWTALCPGRVADPATLCDPDPGDEPCLLCDALNAGGELADRHDAVRERMREDMRADPLWQQSP